MVNQYERAYRAWQILTDYAANRRCITYGELAGKLDIHHRPVGYVLDLIQKHCHEEGRAPLTVLAVNQISGLPGHGFDAGNVDNIEEGKEKVFNYPWPSVINPFTFASDNTSLDKLVASITEHPEESEDVYSKIKVRGIAQRVFRDALLKVYRNRCAFTGLQFIPCLDAAHIIPWSNSTPSQRMDVRNGILLSSVHHRLFDNKLITLDEKYCIQFYDPDMLNNHPYSEYDRLLTSELHGKDIRLPPDENHWPRQEWIRERNSQIPWMKKA